MKINIKKMLKSFVILSMAAALVMGNSQTAYAQWVFDAVSGGDIEVSETDCVDCIDCGGSGNCALCKGKGTYSLGKRTNRCNICSGTGDCDTCGGTGELTEVEYVVENNKDNTPIGLIRTGSADDLYACRYCYGTGICNFCSGDGINDTTGNKCVYCKGDMGVCNNCDGYGCLTRDEHNQRILEPDPEPETDTDNACTKCGGSGNSSTLCHECGGSGKYKGSSIVTGAFNRFKCLSCDGSGYERCAYCHGTGRE